MSGSLLGLCAASAIICSDEEAPYYGSTPDIELHLHPEAGEMPSRPGWIEVTGLFDHPAATQCADGQWQTILQCRVEFVVTSARAISEP